MRKHTALYEPILLGIRSKSDLDQLQNTIGEILTSLFTIKKTKLDTILDKSLHKPLARAVKDAIKKEKITLTDHDKIKEFFQKLQEAVSRLPLVRLTFAFSPSPKILETTSDWAKNTFGHDAILDIEIDEKILGGAIVVYEGIYKDFSLKNRIQKVFNDHRKEIQPSFS